MTRPILYLVGSTIFLATCSSTLKIQTIPQACEYLRSTQIVSSGIIEIDHGDYLAGDDGVRRFLIRDEQYKEWVYHLDGKSVKLVLTPVDACNVAAGSSMVACIYLGRDGTAYKISEWCKVGE